VVDDDDDEVSVLDVDDVSLVDVVDDGSVVVEEEFAPEFDVFCGDDGDAVTGKIGISPGKIILP
jgi:hypothetical protein